MHQASVFSNSCLNVPVDPISKMPKTSYERNEKVSLEQCSLDSSITYTASDTDLDAEKLKDFYRSIPDYNDINHLSETEFYCTLKTLREKKKIMFNIAIRDITSCNDVVENKPDRQIYVKKKPTYTKIIPTNHEAKENHPESPQLRKHLSSSNKSRRPTNDKTSSIIKEPKQHSYRNTENDTLSIKGMASAERPKRNHSACSITWCDDKTESRKAVDEKFNTFFEKDYFKKYNVEYKAQSMPSSPLRNRRSFSTSYCKHKDITVPRPFKMTQRDEDSRMVNELKGLQKSFSEDMLHQKCSRRQFKAKPVPIESRIPLYDKILQDQAMRRAITKINSEAELRAQMKPFSFTKREESGDGICERAVNVMPKPKKKKRFKARPVPKNLFSNYFYDRMKEENFFRSMNRRIRAEEMLRNSNYPGLAATRDHSRLSTPAAHSDLPTDPSPAAFSGSSMTKYRPTSPIKQLKKNTKRADVDFITTSPQPFHFNTADRANKKITEISKKICQDIKNVDSTENTHASDKSKIYSALDLRGKDIRSNLAALLRAEAVKRKFEMEADKRLTDQMRRMETKHRNRLLRSKPAWDLVKNNYEEDIAMRLQTRRDEERMRREEFLHEMELMYGRVRRQPMLFERYYAPRSGGESVDYIQLSPRKKGVKHRNGKKNKSYSIRNINHFPDSNEETSKYSHKPYDDSDGVMDSLERVI